jgi:nucleotide-binding universal stress UspA family protein
MIRISRILAATDFSDCSNHALRYAYELADTFGAELHLLNVVELAAGAYPEFGIQTRDIEAGQTRNANKALEELPELKWRDKLSIQRAVLVGAPFVEIVRYAREQKIDLIVIGTHGRGAVTHMLMGSTAEKVVRKAPCPVLSVRPDAHEFVMP